MRRRATTWFSYGLTARIFLYRLVKQVSHLCVNKRACGANARGKRPKEKSSQYSSSLLSPQRFNDTLLDFCTFEPLRRREIFVSPSRVFLACSPSRKSWESTRNPPSYCGPPAIRPISNPLSCPLFQRSARPFSPQRKKTDSAAMASTLRMRAHIYPVVTWKRWTTSSVFQARQLRWLIVYRNEITYKIVSRFNRNVLDHWIANKEIKFTAKSVDEDPASYKRWISRKEIQSPKILRTKNEKSKDYCKADQNNVYCFFIAIFRLTIYTSLLQAYRCKPEEGWYGQSKYCNEKTLDCYIHIWKLWMTTRGNTLITFYYSFYTDLNNYALDLVFT